jgi:hypothetical protein
MAYVEANYLPGNSRQIDVDNMQRGKLVHERGAGSRDLESGE